MRFGRYSIVAPAREPGPRCGAWRTRIANKDYASDLAIPQTYNKSIFYSFGNDKRYSFYISESKERYEKRISEKKGNCFEFPETKKVIELHFRDV